MKIEIEILKINVYTGCGTDHVQIYTTLPPGINNCKCNQTIEFKVDAGNGTEYVKKHFGIDAFEFDTSG